MNRLLLVISLVLLCVLADAQIYYFDISPDMVLNNSNSDVLDLNNDGILDVLFTQENPNVDLDGYGVGVTLLNYDVEFVGNNPPYDPSHEYPYRLGPNVLVDIDAASNNWVTKLPGVDVVRVMYIHFNSGADIGEWTGGVSNGYLGIRIKINNNWHYGWIRMAVTINATQLTVKDYAYNLQVDEGIFTGQTVAHSPDSVVVTYDCNYCGNILAYKRKSYLSIAYDKIYLKNQTGSYDSIGFVPAASPSFFVDNDSMIFYETRNYKVSSVDSSGIESLLSDFINSTYLNISTSDGINHTLNWENYSYSLSDPQIITKVNSLCGNSVIYDAVPYNYNMYDDVDSTIGCSGYQIFTIMDSPINIAGYGIIDTIKSNFASYCTSSILNPEAGFDAQIISGSSALNIQFTDTSKAGIINWFWDFGDGSTSTLQNPVHAYSSLGNYNVSLTVSNCYDTDVITRQIPNSVAIEDFMFGQDFSILPNPTNGDIQIKFGKDFSKNAIIEIYSITGKMKLKQTLNSNPQNVDLKFLSRGIYFYKIENSNEDTITGKIVINK